MYAAVNRAPYGLRGFESLPTHQILFMKIYIASRFDKRDEVKKLQKILIEKGHEIVGDWTDHEPIKPYDKNQDAAKEYAADDINGVKNSDIFIILSDKAGTGMYVELGAAIASKILIGKPEIYVVGDHNSRSMFYFHHAVKRTANIDDLLNIL